MMKMKHALLLVLAAALPVTVFADDPAPADKAAPSPEAAVERPAPPRNPNMRNRKPCELCGRPGNKDFKAFRKAHSDWKFCPECGRPMKWNGQRPPRRDGDKPALREGNRPARDGDRPRVRGEGDRPRRPPRPPREGDQPAEKPEAAAPAPVAEEG